LLYREGTVLKDVLVLDGGAQPLLTLKQSIKATFAEAPKCTAEIEYAAACVVTSGIVYPAHPSNRLGARGSGEGCTECTDRTYPRDGRLMYGYVRKCTDYGVFVGFAYGLSSLASLPHLSDSFVTSPASLFEVGQTVRAKVCLRTTQPVF
jgi:hypothetical protein